MSFRKFFTLTLCAIGIPTDALAQFSQRYTYYPDHYTAIRLEQTTWMLNVGFLTAMMLIIICAITVCWIDIIREKASESEMQLRRQARLMREMAAHQDSHTDMMRSEIDRSRTSGEHRERSEIAEHESRLRELRRKIR